MSQSFKLHQMHLPKNIIVGECWARDGLQNEAKIVSTEDKVEIITRMVEAGCTKFEATSFAHPKYLPQFADAEEVLRRIPRKPNIQYRGICTTLRGVERAIASREEGYGVDEIAMVISTSEPHNLANVGMTHDENKKVLEQMVRKALDTRHAVFGWALTSFGCPISGDVDPAEAIAMGKWWKNIGATIIGFGDTTGSANPVRVSHFYEYVLAEGFTTDEVVIHFHDTRGWGVANSMVALTFGFRHFDTSLGAIGGQPKTGAAEYHTGYAGNTCTEDLVGMFEEMGVSTGINLSKMIEAGKRAEQILGRKLRSNFVEAGPVPHQGIVYDKSKGILGTRG
ncbi:MAG: hydroxymethylglutaryl-CoA lyase [Candidatus Tectomicrobia bacterium]|uniref:Hydroxymethylglutaryl-CoA lyase n=1 Tax=Tectimicrobiota bacterium TaxID=2528274 RepID=A0A933LQA0_UNCTE|nr:hydroxymethylglutaryl-CoA lyase [Candidatus Tectomicrobia bacterium]